MQGQVDWLSWTLPENETCRSSKDLYIRAKLAMRDAADDWQAFIFNGSGFDPQAARAPYRIGLLRNDHGCKLSGGSQTQTILYELSGRGTDALSENPEVGRAFVGAISDRITRFDYAVDIVSDTRPSVFANQRNHQRVRSIGYQTSSTGETVYLGSTKSDRFTRVYRYNHPHPRAKLLRVEFVYRRELAKQAARHYSVSEDQTFIADAGATVGLGHEDWQPAVLEAIPMKTPVVSRKEQDTVRWLYSQVAPAVRRLLDSGALDLTDWIEYIYNPD